MHSLVITGGPQPPNDKKKLIATIILVVVTVWITFGPSINMLLKD